LDKFNVFYNRLRNEIIAGTVDKLLIDILLSINRDINLFTTSSCSGRISFICTMEGKESKPGARLGSIHGLVNHDGLISKIAQSIRMCEDSLIIRLRGFVLDVFSKDLASIQRLHKIFAKLGFKGFQMKSFGKDGSVIEYASSLRLDIPVKVGNNLLLNINDKASVLSLCNFLLAYLYRNIIEVNIYRLGIWYSYTGNDDATLK